MCRSIGRSLVASLFWATVILLNCNETRGDDCTDLKWDCQFNVSNNIQKILPLLGSAVSGAAPNYTGIVAQCQTTQGIMTRCEQELRKVCPANFNISSLQMSYNSVCGADSLCNMKLAQCQLKPGMLRRITGEMQQRPPNVDRVKGLCSQLNSTLSPCLAELRADCGNVGGFSSSISSITSTYDSICGEGALCLAEVSQCQNLFANMSSLQGVEDSQKMCGLYKEAQKCLSGIKPSCHSRSEVKPVLQALNNPSVTALCSGCPQMLQCFIRPRDEASEVGGGDDEDDECSVMGNLLSCVSSLKGVCDLKEDKMTFKEVENLNQQFCEELKKAGGMQNTCEEMGPCVLQSDLMKKMMGNPESGSIIPHVHLLLNSDTWIQYFKVVSGCVSDLGEDCGFRPGLVSFMTRQHQRLESVSAASLGWKQSTESLVLVLLASALTAWTCGSF